MQSISTARGIGNLPCAQTLFFQPLSWKNRTGLLQQTGNNGQDHLVYQLNPGGGVSFQPNRRVLLYLRGETDLNYGGGLEERYGPGDRHNALEAGLHQNFTLSPNTALRAEVTLSRAYEFHRITARPACSRISSSNEWAERLPR